MRRKDRELVHMEDILAIIETCKVMRMAMAVENVPYMVPLNFGYALEAGQLELYFHCAKAGKKLDFIAQNSYVCFEMDGEHHLITGTSPCEYGYQYQSIIGYGNATMVESPEEKKQYLSILMKHQTGSDYVFGDGQCKNVVVGKITVGEISAKARL